MGLARLELNPAFALSLIWLVSASVEAAELSVGNVTMLAGTAADVVISGDVSNELTYGVELLVEIVSRGGNSGSVTFTPSPPVDTVQADDPWPDVGTFSSFDTDSPGFSDTLNASVDDDGRYLCDRTLDFTGPLSIFPVTASGDAVGVWDVVLSTSVGDSNWECLSATLIAGTVTVSPAACLIDADCDDGDPCTDDVCNLGACEYSQNTALCDDGLPCTSNDVCSNGTCSGTLVDPLTVNLEWSPDVQTVAAGDLVRIELVAVSGACVDQAVGSIQAILYWDPSMMALKGKTDTGPFPWLDSSFPDDSGLDGLNAPFTGMPDNDGDSLYQALASFSSGAEVTPAGLVVTSFEFLALDGTLGTQITIPPTVGSFTRTQVLGAGDTLGMDVTGTLGTGTVRIIECQVDVDCNDGDVCTDDNCVSGVCENPLNTAPCEDGLFCTSNDRCSNGVCVGGPDPCTAPSLCSEALDECLEQPIPTVSEWGVLAMTILILMAGTLVLKRRWQPRAKRPCTIPR